MSLLETAHKIVYERSQEKDRQYGPFDKGMEKAANIATEILNKKITASDICIIMASLKLSRESYYYKEDNILDLLSYMEMYNQLKKAK
jgi:hypothetical protein